ncbi:MAG TPA: hypothetical protein VK879_01905 [Candidatus Sulfomarinibacteraceae bacterium]|nr:hypothetical protein [Candidatus Sulfomarinibacteraceae bacterium]
MNTVECIECAGTVTLDDDLLLGEIVECPDCGVELEVVELDPLSVELAPETVPSWPMGPAIAAWTTRQKNTS